MEDEDLLGKLFNSVGNTVEDLFDDYKPKQQNDRAVTQQDATTVSSVGGRRERARNYVPAGQPLERRQDFSGNFLSYVASGHRRREAYGKLGDLYRYYGGDALKHEVLEKSKYKPTNSSDPNAEYIAINDDEFRNAIKNSYKQIFEENNIPKTANKINEDTYSVSHYYNHQTNSRDNSKALGNLFISRGEDERGKYASYYDVFDRSTGSPTQGLGEILGATKPFEVYDRIYLNEQRPSNQTMRNVNTLFQGTGNYVQDLIQR